MTMLDTPSLLHEACKGKPKRSDKMTDDEAKEIVRERFVLQGFDGEALSFPDPSAVGRSSGGKHWGILVSDDHPTHRNRAGQKACVAVAMSTLEREAATDLAALLTAIADKAATTMRALIEQEHGKFPEVAA